MMEFAVLPFHTKSIYSYSDCRPLFSACVSVRLGIRKLSRISLLRFERSSEEATGDSRPLGVRLEYDSTKPQSEWGNVMKVEWSRKKLRFFKKIGEKTINLNESFGRQEEPGNIRWKGM